VALNINSYISLTSVAKPKNIVVFLFTYVWESLAMFYRDSGVISQSIDCYEIMKQGVKR
jgi:hypothetical protein